MAKAEKKTATTTETAPAVERKQRQRKAALVLPSFSLKRFETGDSFAVMFGSEISEKADIDQKTGKQKMNSKNGEPAVLHLAQVKDLDTGEIGEMVLPFIIHKALVSYAEKHGKLTGASFEFVKGKAESNKATMWEVYEIEA